MKRTLWAILLLLLPLAAMAQDRYMSYTAQGQEDRETADPSVYGVLLFSKCPDLVITSTTPGHFDVKRLGANESGDYRFELTTDSDNPTFEIGRRGGVDIIRMTLKLKRGVLRAYRIEEVGNPIFMQAQNDGNETTEDKDKAFGEVEIFSSIPGMQVQVDPRLHATVVAKEKKGDASVTVTSIRIPVANIKQPLERYARLTSEYDALYDAIMKKPTQALYDKYDRLGQEIKEMSYLDTLMAIGVFGPETNHLTIDVRGLEGEQKLRYGILELRTKVREHVTKYAGFMEEGGRVYGLRNYDEARRAFHQALTATDRPGEMEPAIRTNISDCDTCLLYTRYTTAALTKLKRLKDAGQVNQSDVAEYYSAAVDYLQVLNKYNPCDYYAKSITTLENFIKDMPFTLRFNVVHLKADRVSVGEGGPFAGVQVWAYTGSKAPNPADYDSPHKFRKLQKSLGNQLTLLGVTDTQGVADTEMRRSALPRGFFLVPLNDDWKVRTFYMDAADVMSQAKGTFMKRQFRVKLYHK